MPDLRLIVVASAHDRSLKSERAPRLHALVVARQRARLAEAAFVATSPAPPVDLAADDGLRIETRRGTVRPEIARPRKGPVTPRLLEVVRSALEAGKDALVFAGRRGGALRLRCDDCGWTPECPSCGVGLALERRDRTKRPRVPDVRRHGRGAGRVRNLPGTRRRARLGARAHRARARDGRRSERRSCASWRVTNRPTGRSRRSSSARSLRRTPSGVRCGVCRRSRPAARTS